MAEPLIVILFVCVVAGVFWWVRGGARSAGAEARLLRICRGNEAQADRLIHGDLSRAPGISRSEAAVRAAERYQRDNR